MELRTDDPFETVYHQCRAMLKYSYSRGDLVPVEVIRSFGEVEKEVNEYSLANERTLDNLQLNTYSNIIPLSEKLGTIHNVLADLLQPANPKSIYIIEEGLDSNSFFSKIGCIPFIRRMMIVAIVSMLTFILVSLSPMINTETISKSLFESDGIQLLMYFAFLLSASALGASFSALLKANKYIVNRSFDTKHETCYWIRFIVGLLSGLIITELIPDHFFNNIEEVGKPTLALLAGFSSDLLYNILQHLVSVVENAIVPKASHPNGTPKQSVHRS